MTAQTTSKLGTHSCMQCLKVVMCDSTGLVDFLVMLFDSVKFLEKIFKQIQITEVL